VSVNADSSIPILEAALAVPPVTDTRQATGTESLSTAHSEPKALAPRLPSSLPRSTIIGDLKLTVLKSRLAALGVSAEFAGEGVLVCNGASADSQVAVKKMGRGQVVVEGAPSQVYYLVRQEVYGLHAVVVS
jgi:cleavage and polyadenylation specificity factor subunit 2